MTALAESLRGLPPADTLIVVAAAADKDARAMADALAGVGACWTLDDPALGLCPLPGGRVFAGVGDPSLAPALHEHAQAGGRVVVCGSHRLVGAAMGAWLGEGGPPEPSDPR